MKFVLASGSPRRKKLLKRAGLKFSVIPSRIEEKFKPGVSPKQFVRQNALAKARAVAGRLKSGIVLGVDTEVVLGGKIMGKPRDRAEAVRILNFLSGKTHKVISGLAIVDAATGRTKLSSETTLVKFRRLGKKEILDYVKTGEPLDKAGAYGIQGRAGVFVEKIIGCYSNVVGLPVAKVVKMIKRLKKISIFPDNNGIDFGKHK